MTTFKEHLKINNIQLKCDLDGAVSISTKTVYSKSTKKDETYHILSGKDKNGKLILFIPSLGAWDDHEKGIRKIDDCEVVNDGMTANDGTPIMFLHRPVQYDGRVDLGFEEESIRNYPLISEYVEAIKMAEDNLDKLSSLRPVLDADGHPVMSSGNFAVVFKMEDETDGKLYALKCFTKYQKGRNKAYQQIANELRNVSSPYLVSIKYLSKELFVYSNNSSDNEFPVLVMDWVNGITLDNYIKAVRINQEEMNHLTSEFFKLAEWLLKQPFAHGDLKPDNILVKDDGSLVLVDYDGMFVPAMKGQQAREIGSPNFRLPNRDINTFDRNIDDFPITTISLAMRAITLKPELLDEFNASDALLFVEDDFRNIARCELYHKLCTMMSDHSLSQLILALHLSFTGVPIGNAYFKITQGVIDSFENQYPFPDYTKPGESNEEITKDNDCHGNHWVSEQDYKIIGYRPQELDVSSDESFSTEVTDEDKQNGEIDTFGFIYSPDWKRLLQSDPKATQCVIKTGTKVICNDVFACDNAYYSKCSKLRSGTIPNTVTHIGDNVFWGCSSLTCVNIPDSVIHIGKDVFNACEFLTSISVHKNNKVYDSRNDCNAIIHTATNTLIAGCKNTIIPNTVTKIGEDAFYGCYGLTSLKIPDSVIQIEDGAFYGNDLTDITFPNTITHIGERAFQCCRELKSIDIPESVVCIGERAFGECCDIATVSVNVQNKVYDSRNRSNAIVHTATNTLLVGCKNTVIPNTVTHIGDWAFCGCIGLKSIDFPNSITHIGNSAFRNCNNLISVTIPDSVTFIGKNAFSGCLKLASITIPNSVTNIENSAFYGCDGLTSILVDNNKVYDSRNDCNAIIRTATNTLIVGCKNTIIPDSVIHIGTVAFGGCKYLKDIAIPSSVTHIDDGAFIGCGLTHITIPNSVTHIGNRAFDHCVRLMNVTLPDSVIHIGEDAFKGCHESASFYIPRGCREKFIKLLGTSISSKLIEK